MAFIFVPNADGSFTEGDKQTNPDTGVEYCYIDGAWRALGPKIEDEFDTLDDRYIKLNGRSDVGDAYTIKGPGETTGATSTFHQIKDGKQYLYHIDTPQDSNTEWVANVSYVKSKTDDKMSKQGTQTVNSDHWKIIQPNQDGNNRTFVDIYDGEMHLYNVADPTNGADGWAVNKGYVDTLFSSSGGGSYLPLTGGDLTGKIDITIDSPGNAAIRTIGSINVKGDGQGIGGSNNFIAHKDYVRVYSTPSSPQDVVNKEYAEGHFAATGHTHDYKKAALWKAVSPSTAAGDLQVGEFFVADNNNIYLNPKSANGIDLGISGTTEYSQSMTYLASIYGRGTYNSLYSTVADKINFNVSSNNYIRVQSSHLLYKQGFSVGTQYVINIPGFTP